MVQSQDLTSNMASKVTKTIGFILCLASLMMAAGARRRLQNLQLKRALNTNNDDQCLTWKPTMRASNSLSDRSITVDYCDPHATLPESVAVQVCLKSSSGDNDKCEYQKQSDGCKLTFKNLTDHSYIAKVRADCSCFKRRKLGEHCDNSWLTLKEVIYFPVAAKITNARPSTEDRRRATFELIVIIASSLLLTILLIAMAIICYCNGSYRTWCPRRSPSEPDKEPTKVIPLSLLSPLPESGTSHEQTEVGGDVSSHDVLYNPLSISDSRSIGSWETIDDENTEVKWSLLPNLQLSATHGNIYSAAGGHARTRSWESQREVGHSNSSPAAHECLANRIFRNRELRTPRSLYTLHEHKDNTASPYYFDSDSESAIIFPSLHWPLNPNLPTRLYPVPDHLLFPPAGLK